MVSPRRKTIQSNHRRHPSSSVARDIPDDEGSTSSGGDWSAPSNYSSSYAGLTSEEEDRPLPRNVTDDEESEESGDSEDEKNTDDERSLASEKAQSVSSQDPLARLLQCDKTLTRMDINHRNLKEWSSALPIEDIMAEIAKQSSLKILCLDMDNIPMSKYDVLVECIGRAEWLQEVILCKARVNRNTANAIATAFADNRKSLRKLSFRSCTFAGSGFSIMFLGVQHVSGLTHLSIEDCSLQGFASEILAATVPLLKTLKCLRLAKTQLPVEGMRYLFDNLALSQSVVELDLSENEFDVQATSWLVGCLESPDTKIEKLSLASCSLDATCLEILTRALAKDKVLKALNLADNPFGNAGAISLVQLMKENHDIQGLNIKGCHIGKKSLNKLRNGLRYNNSFLKNVFSTEISLAILDSVSMMEKLPGSFG